MARRTMRFIVRFEQVSHEFATGWGSIAPGFSAKHAAPVRSKACSSTQGDAMQSSTDVKFKVGDKAVYPAQGVAEVIKIEEKDIAGSRQQFYVLRILDTDRKIMVPVSNASAVGLRQVISEVEIREIFDILKERTIAFDNQTWNRRYRGFMDKIKTGSIYDVAEVLRDLYRLKTDKQLSFGERRMLDTARTLIVKEIAIARSQTEEQVKTEIEAIFVAN
jgi:CarD family transcriptional regulator